MAHPKQAGEVAGRLMTTSGESAFFAYILHCSDGSLYVWYTRDVDARLLAHNAGRGAAWTASRRTVELAFRESHAEQGTAIARERQINRWTHKKASIGPRGLGNVETIGQAARSLRAAPEVGAWLLSSRGPRNGAESVCVPIHRHRH